MKKTKKIRLGVNIDHAATLRQVRGGTTPYPDMLNVASLAIDGGADLITIHLREDRRHIQDDDVRILIKNLDVPVNLELSTSPDILKKAYLYKPDWVCFVPEKRQELTTEGGLDVLRAKRSLGKIFDKFQSIGVEITTFIEPSLEQIKASFDLGADSIELHTGKWALLKDKNKKANEWARLNEAAEFAHFLGLEVHAGHGLDFQTAIEIRELPHLKEVNIGHSLICYSLEYGLTKSVKSMKRLLCHGKI